MERIRLVPPSPEVMASLFEEYLREGRDQGMTFTQYLEFIGYTNPAGDLHGMDDGARFARATEGPELISVPAQSVQGRLRIIVLLIDFADREGDLPESHYRDLLFSKNSHPTGSLRDYYKEVSLDKVDVTGSIHGWFRMPQTYAFYTNGESGTKWNSYPRNAPRMAEDAVQAALDNGVTFEPELDLLGQGVITALFIVHAGLGAEVLSPSIRGNHIWSHKWNLRSPIGVADNLLATVYLTVPHDAKLGVCAHELGHLAFQWEDFYDPNYAEDGKEWDGSGNWDLMAGGSYNGQSRFPAHPVALHKAQHNWIEVEEIRRSQSLTLEPFTATSGKTVKLVNSSFTPGQYLILENRTRFGFDTHLPGEGLLVWRVDEFKEMFAPDRPALQLVQADGRHELETVGDNNAGDRGDPFPGLTDRTELRDTGNISTSFPGGDNSGIVLKRIQRDPATGIITLDVEFDGIPVSDQPPDDEGDTTDNLQIVSDETSPELAIPDNEPGGINSSIAIAEKGAAREIAVSVDILHTYIGDLRVELTAPSGQRAVLHNRTGGTAENLKKIYRSSADPLLAELVDTPIEGQWVLHVADLEGADTGELKKWGLALAVDQQKPSVHEARTPELPIPDNDPSGIASTIAVSRGGIVRNMAVEVDIAHTFRRDLRVELLNPQRDIAVLHNRTGGDADDLKVTYLSRETPAMAGFIGKRARGDWTLRVSDLEGQDRGTFNRWVLDIELEPATKVVDQAATPNLPIPDDDATGVGSAVAVSQSGTAQNIEIDLAITHPYIGDLRVELVAPSGARAILHDQAGGRQNNLALQLDSATSTEITGLIGQPIKGNWILRVMDLAGRDVGTLDTWSLRLFYV